MVFVGVGTLFASKKRETFTEMNIAVDDEANGEKPNKLICVPKQFSAGNSQTVVAANDD